MPKEKTRPSDNSHFFQGPWRGYWMDKARGLSPEIKNGADGYFIRYAIDADGSAVNNGGIGAPVARKMPPNTRYFRFFSSAAHRKYGSDGWVGGWWLRDETYSALASEAQNAGESLAVAARRRLALPSEWKNDCAYVACVVAIRPFWAWTGAGKLAHGRFSPGSAMQKRASGGLVGDAPHRAPEHVFVPGDRDDIKRMFRLIAVDHANTGRPTFRLSSLQR